MSPNQKKFQSKRRNASRRYRPIIKQLLNDGVCYCSYCTRSLIKKEDVTLDHVIPLSANGVNNLSNITTACKECNRQKRDSIWTVIKYSPPFLSPAQSDVLAAQKKDAV